jgi:hypothetical protein
MGRQSVRKLSNGTQSCRRSRSTIHGELQQPMQVNERGEFMSFKKNLMAVGLVLSFAWATTAQAQTAVYSLSGNSRAQIGAGLPLPITFQPAPNGKVLFGPPAFVFQTAGPDPKAMTFQLNTATPIFGPVTATAFVALFNPRVHQVKTSLIVNGPVGGTAMFSAGGRTGPATLTWCPGQALPTASFNPACTNATSATAVHGATQNASLRYQATANQFGGTSQGLIGGGASVVIRAGATLAPCKAVALGGTNASCLGAFSLPVINPTAIGGAPFGAVNITTPALSKNVHFIGVLANGQVTAVHPALLGTAPKNNVKTYGAPYTTGKVTVRAPLALGGGETFYLSGSDNRVDGVGSISLVTGGIGARSISGTNANRGWLNYEVTPFSVPSISNGGLILLGSIFLAATAWMVRRAVATA